MSGNALHETLAGGVPLSFLNTNSTQPNNLSRTSIQPFNPQPGSDYHDGQNSSSVLQRPEQTVRRKLEGKHIFMIAINGTLGTGLYIRSGQVLEIGGPVAVILSFFLVGVLAWAVMQCLAELLCLWPVPGAVPLFVAKFVDPELGDTVGIAYWFTYSIGFSALIATTAHVLNYWTSTVGGFTEGFVYVALPVILVIINTVKVEIYGWIEVVTGVIKMAFLIIIMICLVYIISTSNVRDISSWRNPLTPDRDAANEWFEALMICFSIAIFAYSGVENFAVSVIEARWPTPPSQPLSPSTNTPHRSASKTLGRIAFFLPIIIAFAYTTNALLISLSIKRGDCGLQIPSWLKDAANKCQDEEQSTTSPFVIIAKNSGIHGLNDVFNAFIVFTALTCASTNLYVASRTLFGITRNLESREAIPRAFSWFGVTNNNGVPIRAMIFTALAFCWVPFLGTKEKFVTILEMLVQMGSVSIIIIWACLCLAYIRFYHCIGTCKASLMDAGINLHSDRRQHNPDLYLFQSHWQPVLAYLALAGCLFILVICNGVFLWKGFHLIPFLLGYLTTIVFIFVWLLLKAYKNSSLAWVVLTPYEVVKVVQTLNEIRNRSLDQPPRVERSLLAFIKNIFKWRRNTSTVEGEATPSG